MTRTEYTDAIELVRHDLERNLSEMERITRKSKGSAHFAESKKIYDAMYRAWSDLDEVICRYQDAEQHDTANTL